MFKLDIPQSPKEAAAVAARREREAARRERVHNPRMMKMGMDYQALAQQVDERKQIEEIDAMHGAMVGEQLNRQDRLLQMMENRQRSDAKALNKAVVEYRQTYQKPEMRREFDLNDPDSLKNEVPAPVREGDDGDDARFGAASMQYFEGEDNFAKARSDLQKQQMREWVAGSVAEHDAVAAAAAEEKRDADTVIAMQIAHTQHEMEREAKFRQDQYMAARAENAKLMAEQSAKKQAEKEQEQMSDYRDVITQVNGDLLDDSPAGGYDQYGRIKHPKSFRGFMPEQVAAIRGEQAYQEAEVAERRRQEQILEAQYHQQEADQARMAHLAERRATREAKAYAQDLTQTNAQLSTTRQTHCIAQNQVKHDFFNQFGTGSR